MSSFITNTIKHINSKAMKMISLNHKFKEPVLKLISKKFDYKRKIHFLRFENKKENRITNFLLGLSHELKTPLNSTIGGCQNLQEFVRELTEISDNLPKNYPDYDRIEKLLNKCNRAICLINSGNNHFKDIISEFNSNIIKGEGKYTKVSITNLFNKVNDKLKELFKNSNVEIIIKTNNVPEINIVEQEIEQVFINLIKNSLDNFKNGGEILVNCTKKDNKLIIIFKDNGEGIPEKNLNKIFEPLFTSKKSSDSTGLGLYLSKEIIKNHSGNISAKNNNGAEFLIELPYK